MKRDLAVYCLEREGRQVLVEPGARAEGHWMGQGYQATGSGDSPPVESPVVNGGTGDVKPKRRGRKPAVAAEGESDE